MFGKHDFDVAVAGGGPVGLFTGLCLVARGLSTAVIETDFRGPPGPTAVALGPRALKLLDDLGVAVDLVARGRRVPRVAFYRGAQRIGHVDAEAQGGLYPFLLVVTRDALRDVLGEAFEKRGGTLHGRHELMGFDDGVGGVRLDVAKLERVFTGYGVAHTEWEVQKRFEDRARFLIGADGEDSFVRRRLGIPFQATGRETWFAIFDTKASVVSQHEMVVLLEEGALGAFLPVGLDRGWWAFQVPPDTAGPLTMAHLRDLVRERAVWFTGEPADSLEQAALMRCTPGAAASLGRGRVWLVGDAAHVAPPLGFRGLNAGLIEAQDLAARVADCLAGTGDVEPYAAAVRERWSRIGAPVAAPHWAGEDAARIAASLPGTDEEAAALLDPTRRR